MLDDIVSRLISAARGTPTLINNSTSLSAAAITEPIPNACACSHSLTESTPGTLDGQSQGDPVNRDIPPTTVDSTPSRAGENCELSFDHCPGDAEMPNGSTHGSTNTVSNRTNKVLPHRHSDRQSPTPSALLAYQSNPPDEDIMPKRVAGHSVSVCCCGGDMNVYICWMIFFP